MSFVINTNVSSLNAQNNLDKSRNMLAQATQRLSSGLKINSAADNAAGFAISQRYTTQIGGLAQASANASDAINLAQTTGSALDQVTANLQAIRDLAAQSANGTYSNADRATIDNEVQQRLQEITRIANQTTFNGKKVLDGSLKSTSFQIGADVGQTVSVALGQSVKSSDMGAIAEVKSGDISGSFSGGLTLATGDLTVAVGTNAAVNVAAGTYTSVAGLAKAINSATNSSIATVDATTGQLDIAASAGAGAVTIGGSAATKLGLATTQQTANFSATSSISATQDHSGELLTINGTNVDLTGVSSLQALSDAINAAGVDGVSAAVSSDGKGVNFFANGPLTITDTNKATSTGTTASVITVGKATDGNTGLAFTSGSTAATAGNLGGGGVGTVDGANDLMARIDVALKTVSDFAAQLGAVQNRFQSTISTLSSQSTNLKASQSTIQDADFAAETANLSKAQVLQQAGISVLSQANSQPQQILKLLQ